MKARFVQQGASVDYIPDDNVVAGQVVVINDLIGITRHDIKGGELGILAVAPSPIFEMEKGAALAFAYGAKVYWDTANEKVAAAEGAGIKLLGLCVTPKGSLASDSHCRIRLV